MIRKVLVYAWFGPFRIEEDDGSIWEVNMKTTRFEKVASLDDKGMEK